MTVHSCRINKYACLNCFYARVYELAMLPPNTFSPFNRLSFFCLSLSFLGRSFRIQCIVHATWYFYLILFSGKTVGFLLQNKVYLIWFELKLYCALCWCVWYMQNAAKPTTTKWRKKNPQKIDSKWMKHSHSFSIFVFIEPRYQLKHIHNASLLWINFRMHVSWWL